MDRVLSSFRKAINIKHLDLTDIIPSTKESIGFEINTSAVEFFLLTYAYDYLKLNTDFYGNFHQLSL